jgi:hypothetical protein
MLKRIEQPLTGPGYETKLVFDGRLDGPLHEKRQLLARLHEFVSTNQDYSLPAFGSVLHNLRFCTRFGRLKHPIAGTVRKPQTRKGGGRANSRCS